MRPFPFERRARRSSRAELGLSLEQALPRVRGAADRGRVDRPGAPRVAPERRRRSPSRCSGPNAPRQIESDLALLYQAARLIKERVRVARLHRRARARRRVRALDPPGARLPLEGRQRRHVPPQLRRLATRRVPQVYWSYSGARVLDARVPRRRAARRPRLRRRRSSSAGELAYLVDRGLDGDDLPARLLPRRPAPGERARARRRRGSASSTSASSGKLTDDDMARLTRLFIDAANENIEALPRRLADLGVRYPKEREEEFARRAARALLPLLRRQPRRDRPDPGDPRGVRAHLLDEPAPADAVRAPRQGRSRRSARSASTSTRTSTSSRSRSRTRAR